MQQSLRLGDNLPVATYRLQLTPAFGFRQLQEVLPYLERLGITCIYASPILKARRGSTHGYDVVDCSRVNPELGGEEALFELLDQVRAHGMGWLQDIVPNHMAFDSQNTILADVLENGQNSRYFDFFDVEWDHPYEAIRGRVLAPFLGSFYGESLESSEIRLRYDQNGFSVYYYNMNFPLRIESYSDLLTWRLEALRRKIPRIHPDFIKLHGILGVLFILRTLPSGAVSNERYDQISFIKVLLWELYNQNPEIRDFIDETVAVLNTRDEYPESIRYMERLLGEQFFRLSFWKVAVEEINYRRFFSINDLICLKVEDQRVFDHVHSLVFKLVDEGRITGLRIDHIDGLYDPTHYLRRIRRRTAKIYTVVEKILAYGESIPEFWPVEGTTGYDFMNMVNGLFCDHDNEKIFDRIYERYTGIPTSFHEICREKRKLIAERRMAGDVENLARLIKNISNRYRRGSDLTLLGMKRAIVQVLGCMSVYRTYISGDSFRPEDAAYMKEAVDLAREENPDLLHELSLIEDLHSPEFMEGLPETEREDWMRAAMRFQQCTAPLMAKGVEDTAFYVYNRLLSLNEVGGHPERFGVSLADFHEFNRKRLKSCPLTMNATSTHDSKRGEDVRARLNVLSEVPREWEKMLRAWSRINSPARRLLGERRVPSLNEEYALYQTLLGAFPFEAEEVEAFLERMKDYVIKAAREAKTHTSWLTPDKEYEDALISFLEAILTGEGSRRFLEAFLPFQRKIASYGIWNSLSQALLKIASPGVPDFYQGCELWDLNLVDPDNRRPVDFEKRRLFLEEIIRRSEEDMPNLMAELLKHRVDGRLKLFLIYRGLKGRRDNARAFEEGAYSPVEIRGRHRWNVVAFARVLEGVAIVAIVPRFLVGLVEEGVMPLGHEVWQDTWLVLSSLYGGIWKNLITEEILERQKAIPVGEVLRQFPAALLVNIP